jgi:hypothetical protein
MHQIRQGASKVALSAILAGTSIFAAGSAPMQAQDCSSFSHAETPIVQPAPPSLSLYPWTAQKTIVVAPRALSAWQALEKNFAIPGCPGFFANEPGGKAQAELWQYSQAIAAALDMARLTGNFAPAAQMLSILPHYQHEASYFKNGKEGYSPSTNPNSATRYYDDNSWIGLNFMQAYAQTKNPLYLHQAEKLFQFIKTGQHPQGGMLWREGDSTRTFNMPATGSSTEFALRLYQATGNAKYLHFAQKNLAFMDAHLLIKQGPHRGLYADSVMLNTNGTWTQSPNLWSYNQGTAIGSHLLMYEILKGEGKTKEAQGYLNQAQKTISASLNYFQGETLWKQPAAFNAIFFRNLPENPQTKEVFGHYLNSVWLEARDPHTGIFYKGGIKLYGSNNPKGDLLDQAAVVQMFVIHALPAQNLKSIS